MDKQGNSSDISLSGIESLLRQVQGILEVRAKVPKAAGADFNIFSVLHMERDEVNTHCRLIYELLNPDGSHGMGDTFLREFFSVLSLHYPENAAVTVSREYSFSDGRIGRIDLLLEGSGFCYPIEAKIGAPDQDEQISRYTAYARKRAEESRVFYLTLHGDEPSENSTRADSNLNFTCISFEYEIRRWLLRCGELAWSVPAVSEIIRQYISLVDKLTGQVTEDRFMEMVQKLAGASKESYESAAEIESAMPYVRAEMMIRVFREVREHMESRMKPDFQNFEEESLLYYQTEGKRREKHEPFMTYPITKAGEYTFAMEFGIEWYPFISFALWKSGKEFDAQATRDLPSVFTHPDWKSWLDTFEHEDGYGWWKTFSEESPLDFWNCGGCYSNLYDSIEHDRIMRQIFWEIDTCLEKLSEMGIMKC